MIETVYNLFAALGNVVRFLGVDLWPVTLTAMLGGAAVYVLLPRPRPHPWWWGVLLGTTALVLAGAVVLHGGALTAETLFFYVFSGSAVAAGVLLVTQHNPARAALSFALVVLSVCGLFLLLAAPFLMAATVIVYAGAIIVTFLFVLMLAQQSGLGDADARSREPLLATVTGFVLLGALVYVLQATYLRGDAVPVLDRLLAETRAARRQLDSGDAAALDRFPSARLLPVLQEAEQEEDARRPGAAELAAVRNQVEGQDLVWPDAKNSRAAEVRAALDRLEATLARARQQHGSPQPGGRRPQSDLSGTPSNAAADQIRVGPDGRPRMPHENSAYLGRSLFTDYLLPVELGGVLLLVAVVGAVAIAHRRTAPERPTL